MQISGNYAATGVKMSAKAKNSVAFGSGATAFAEKAAETVVKTKLAAPYWGNVKSMLVNTVIPLPGAVTYAGGVAAAAAGGTAGLIAGAVLIPVGLATMFFMAPLGVKYWANRGLTIVPKIASKI